MTESNLIANGQGDGECALVSVILPTYNRASLIGASIQSVLLQTYKNFELIIVDDGSTDETAKVVRSYSDPRIRYVRQENKGRSNARNHALALAKGKYITFLDSDDLYLPEKIELQVAYLSEHPETSMVYTSAYCIDEQGGMLGEKYIASVSGYIYDQIAFFRPVTITLPTVMTYKSVMDDVSGFDECMHRFEDTDMWRRISKKYRIDAMPEFTCRLRTHSDNSLQSQNPEAIKEALSYYTKKILEEDRNVPLPIRQMGIANLYTYYCAAFMTVPQFRSIGNEFREIARQFDNEITQILQVNYTDQFGSRFNGGALSAWLRAKGYRARSAVGVKSSEGGDSFALRPNWGISSRKKYAKFIRLLEWLTGLQGVFYPQSFIFARDSRFLSADVVHYHIIHNGLFNYLALPLLTKLKPTVWTLHDPWAMTGHCIHPFECDGWKTGCSPCPHLEYPFRMRKDRAWLNFKIKKWVYSRSQLELIVSSQWMMDRVKQSPLLQRFKTHLVPFGVDLNVFRPGDKSAAKARLGIRQDRIVLAFRALGGQFKGLEYTLAALQALPADLPVHILTCHQTDLCKSLEGKFPITDLGELHGDAPMAEFFQATDIHLMPSMAESFGMMAMEAAACGVPSVVFSGTPLGEICFAPEGGIAVEKGNSALLAEAILTLVKDEVRRKAMGARARELAERHYDFNRYAERTLEIYQALIAQRAERKEK